MCKKKILYALKGANRIKAAHIKPRRPYYINLSCCASSNPGQLKTESCALCLCRPVSTSPCRFLPSPRHRVVSYRRRVSESCGLSYI